MILSRSHIYRLEQLLDRDTLCDVFLGYGEVVADSVNDFHCWSLNMHRSILPSDRDFYEQLGWMILFLVSEEELWFSLDDPHVVFWCKCHFLNTRDDQYHYMDIMRDYMTECVATQTLRKEHLLGLLIQAIEEYKEHIPQEPHAAYHIAY